MNASMLESWGIRIFVTRPQIHTSEINRMAGVLDRWVRCFSNSHIHYFSILNASIHMDGCRILLTSRLKNSLQRLINYYWVEKEEDHPAFCHLTGGEEWIWALPAPAEKSCREGQECILQCESTNFMGSNCTSNNTCPWAVVIEVIVGNTTRRKGEMSERWAAWAGKATLMGGGL